MMHFYRRKNVFITRWMLGGLHRSTDLTGEQLSPFLPGQQTGIATHHGHVYQGVNGADESAAEGGAQVLKVDRS